jgi:dipeptidyl aminopeptidase/acylaminoacyl peptidase
MRKEYRSAGRAAALTMLFFAATDLACWSAPSADAFGDLPHAGIGKLSPDGKHLAVVQPLNGRDDVAIYDLTKTGSPPHMVALETAHAENVVWANNQRVLCIFRANLKQKWSKDIHSWSRTISVDADGQNAVLLLHGQPFLKTNFSGSEIVDMAADDPSHIYMVAYVKHDSGYTTDLFKVDVTTGDAELVLLGTPWTDQYLMDGNGHVLGRVEQDSSLTNHVMIGGSDVFSFEAKGGRTFDIDGLTVGENPLFVVRKATAWGTTGLYTWAPSAGFARTLFENPNYDLEDTIADERTGRIIGYTYVDDAVRVKYFDPAMQRIQDSLEKAFPGQSVRIVSKDDAGTEYVVETDGPRNPPVLSLYTPANHQVNIIQQAYDTITTADLGEVKPYPYKSRDGLDIHAYLTLPPGRPARNLPTVIFPHGGPDARDQLEFDWWAQFMASRGYAVLQPNYRGSRGYGAQFVTAGDGEWFRKVQYDVQDGVQKLVADGIADPKRICIVGASWGGYMALTAASVSPDLYRCAVSYAGPADMAHLLYIGTTFDYEPVALWKRRMGGDKVDMDTESPAMHADEVKIPVLLLHSENDVTVPIDQSEIEEKALKRAGKDVEFVRLAGDDHNLQLAPARIQLLKEVDRFLAAHIGN